VQGACPKRRGPAWHRGSPRKWYLVHLPRLHPHLGQVSGRQECGAAAHSSHILIRCSTRRSTIRRATDFSNSGCGMLPKYRLLTLGGGRARKRTTDLRRGSWRHHCVEPYPRTEGWRSRVGQRVPSNVSLQALVVWRDQASLGWTALSVSEQGQACTCEIPNRPQTRRPGNSNGRTSAPRASIPSRLRSGSAIAVPRARVEGAWQAAPAQRHHHAGRWNRSRSGGRGRLRFRHDPLLDDERRLSTDDFTPATTGISRALLPGQERCPH
jgi:hypothetical protein